MTRFAIVGGRVVRGDVVDDCAIVVRDGVIVDLPAPRALPDGIARVDVRGALVTPGLIDVHVHGATGLSFSDAAGESIDGVLAFLATRGVTLAQASLSTDSLDRLEVAMDVVAGHRPGRPGARLHGVHLEGPFLAHEQRGAHNPVLLRRPQDGDAERLLAHGDVLRMVTLAPELPGAVELTRRLVGGGVVVAAGHSATGRDHLAAAIDAGLSHVTHLWSGQSNVTRSGPWRVPGSLELSLASDGLTAEVIADGRHLPPELLTIARRCLGDRLCLVSDGVSGMGFAQGTRYVEGGLPVEVRDGVCMLADGSGFAGSTTPLDAMLRHVVRDLGWPVPEAVRMASTVPAAVLGQPRKGVVERGRDADLAIFSDDFVCIGTLVGGTWVHGGPGTTLTRSDDRVER